MADLKILLSKQSSDQQQYQKILQELEDLQAIQEDLKNLIDGQRDSVEVIQEDIKATDDNIESGVKDLKLARYFNVKYLPIGVGAVLGTAVGAVAGGPIGAAAGFKAGTAAATATVVGMTASAGLLGGSVGYGIQK